MPQLEIGEVFKSYVGAVFERAGAELAGMVGAPVETAVEAPRRSPFEELRAQVGEAALVVSGSLSGAISGPIGFVVAKEDAARLACRLRQASEEETQTRLAGPLSEEDAAAVVFALARVGASAADVWRDKVGGEVRWPAEATELRAARVDVPVGLAEAVGALGGSDAVGVRILLKEPVGVTVGLVVPVQTVEALVGLAEPGARWADAVPQDGRAVGEQWKGLARLLPARLAVRVVLARRVATLRELSELAPGRILDLDKRSGQPLELFAGQKLIARGEAMVVDEHYGFRVAELAPGGAAGERPRRLLMP